MGFGHRVYKNYDPRATVMQKTCHEVLKEVGDENDPLLQVALELERIALSDEYFIERKLYPNVDFYSGITLRALGFPAEMFTVLFAVARTVGWISQWKEMIEDPAYKIGRPRQLYTGALRAPVRAGRQARLSPAQNGVFRQDLQHRVGGGSDGSGPPRPILSSAAYCARTWRLRISPLSRRRPTSRARFGPVQASCTSSGATKAWAAILNSVM